MYTIKGHKKQVVISREKNYTEGKTFNYYLTLLTRDTFGQFVINQTYTQEKNIYSKKLAFKIARDLVS